MPRVVMKTGDKFELDQNKTKLRCIFHFAANEPWERLSQY